jgi:hypothetical protein
MKWLVAIVVVACSQPAPATMSNTDPTGPIKVVSLVDANANIGKRVTVYGKAGNAKLGAVIQTAGRLVIYCMELEAWPAGVDGTYVTARGTLEQSHAYEATHGPNGEAEQGTGGPIWVLAHCEHDK